MKNLKVWDGELKRFRKATKKERMKWRLRDIYRSAAMKYCWMPWI